MKLAPLLTVCKLGYTMSAANGSFSCGKDFRNTDYEQDMDERVILLFDMDCFEVQVHEQPHQRGLPRVVINSSGRILAVSYEAKQLGINRQSTPYWDQAVAKYHQLIAIEVPTRHQQTCHGRARPDTSVTRDATSRIVSAIKNSIPKDSIFQYSSPDEFYVDITEYVSLKEGEVRFLDEMDGLWPNTFLYNGAVVGQPTPGYLYPRLGTLDRKRRISQLELQELRLIYGSTVASHVVDQILAQTGYQSSVGIGSKKLISKIASGMHKPGSVTIFAPSGLWKFSSFVKIEDIPGLGGKLGVAIKDYFQVSSMYELQNIPYESLLDIMDAKTATEVLNWAYGVDDEWVEPRGCFATSGTTRRLYGTNYSRQHIHDILHEQIDETLEKLQFEQYENYRVPTKIKMSITVKNGDNLNSTVPINKLPNHDWLFWQFRVYCVPSNGLNNWNLNWKLENLKIVAHF